MIDFSLTEDQKMLRRTAHDFAEKEIRPVAPEIDREPDPNKCFAMAKEVVAKGLQLGFGKITVPEKHGGYGGSILDNCIVHEELAWGDAGIARGILINNSIASYLARMGSEALKEKWLRPFTEDKTGTFCFAGSATEPTGASEIVCPLPDPSLGMRTTAVRDGDEYVINGQKCFCSCGGEPKAISLVVRTDRTKPNWESCSRFWVPMDTPGVTRGKLENKMGLRSYTQIELFFENVGIPAENMLGAEGSVMAQSPPMIGLAGNPLTGTTALGIARAAYETALQYATERKIWGRPIREYELIAAKLVDMRMQIEAGRALIWKIAWAVAHREESEGLYKLSSMAKILPTSFVRGITIEALQILGGYGYMRDYPVEKYVRDAMFLPIIEGTNELHTIFLAEQL